MFALEWIRNKFASLRRKDAPSPDTVTTMDTPDMAMMKVRQLLEEVDLDSLQIRVILYHNKINFYLRWKAHVDYVNQGKDYCTVEKTEHTKNAEISTKKLNKNFLDAFFNDFSSILQICKPYLREGELNISIDDGHDVRPTKIPMLQLFKNYQKIMNFFDDHPMKIKKLEITVVENSQTSNILSIIKTEELIVYGSFGGADSLNFGEIVKLENWKDIKNLSILFIAVVHPITLFLDKPAVFIGIDSISSDEIRLIVKTFRNNPSMENWRLYFGDDLDVTDLLVRELGQPSQKDEWYFNVPGSEKVFNVNIRLYRTLEFYYLNRDKVPEGIEIH